jgi:hypothetical protein
MLAGPLDLGVLALRMPLDLNRRNARVQIHADMPSGQRGMRLELREMSLALDRPHFILNPTRCARSAIEARFEGDEGARATASAPFQLRRCGALGFRPSLGIGVTGGGAATDHGANPGLRAVIKLRRGGSNLRRLALVMPAAEQLDPAHMENVCVSKEASSERGCPRDTIYGSASLRTSILDKPLRGPIYMRASPHRFPDLVAVLDGPIQLELSGRMTFPDGRVQIVFDQIPDVPVSRISLRIAGGKRGVLVNNRDLCGAQPFARALATAQNGIAKTIGSPLAVPCD